MDVPFPGPWLALGLAMAGPWPGPWLVQTISDYFGLVRNILEYAGAGEGVIYGMIRDSSMEQLGIIPWNSMVVLGIPLNSIDFHRIPQNSTEFNRIQLNSI